LPWTCWIRLTAGPGFGSLSSISHIFFAAYLERSDPVELVTANTSMLVNLVEVIEARSPALEHIQLTQGSKWYGSHLGPLQDAREGRRSTPHAAEFLL
jgi:hypothetical protein